MGSLTGGVTTRLKMETLVRASSNVHRPNGQPNVFLFAAPRGGSTWVKEMVWSQPGFKSIDEPLNLRKPMVRQHLGISDWTTLYNRESTPAISRYIRGFCDGSLKFMNPRPLRRYYRPLTHRIVFKIHEAEDRTQLLKREFNGRNVILIRHPIAVTISREVLPRLDAFFRSDYSEHFTMEQLAYGKRILDYGTHLEKGVLDWCFQTAVPLRQATPDDVLVTYEQMVLDPEPVIERMAQALQLPDKQRMLDQLTVASKVKAKSDQSTQRLLEQESTEARRKLVDKWRSKVDADDERRAMDILRAFDVDAYQTGDVRPADYLWIR